MKVIYGYKYVKKANLYQVWGHHNKENKSDLYEWFEDENKAKQRVEELSGRG